jgi:hypothetical protein
MWVAGEAQVGESKMARDWEAIERLLSVYRQLLDHPKLKPLLDEVERELETLQDKHNGSQSSPQQSRMTGAFRSTSSDDRRA